MARRKTRRGSEGKIQDSKDTRVHVITKGTQEIGAGRDTGAQGHMSAKYWNGRAPDCSRAQRVHHSVRLLVVSCKILSLKHTFSGGGSVA